MMKWRQIIPKKKTKPMFMKLRVKDFANNPPMQCNESIVTFF